MIKIISYCDDIAGFANEIGCKVIKNEPMKNHTSFKIGGNADLFIYVNKIESLKQIVNLINILDVPFFIIGNGSNLLVSDDGYRGVVISLSKIKNKAEIKNQDILTCDAGLPLAYVCTFAMKNSLSGLEFACGIPGTCGGALFMNAGAYGHDMSETILEATHVTYTGNEETLSKSQMNLSYRNSIYSSLPVIITSMSLKLVKSSSEEIKSKMYENIKKRKLSQPLNYPNAGSIFKRPSDGQYAGKLIESAGLKGVSIGGASVSQKHAGFIVNTGDATAQDVIKLIHHIQRSVFENSGVKLNCEIKTLGNITLE